MLSRDLTFSKVACQKTIRTEEVVVGHVRDRIIILALAVIVYQVI